MGTAEQVEVKVRAVTDNEVETFHENGWVKLPGLISPELAAQLLERAKQLMGVEGDAKTRPGLDLDFSWWQDYTYPSRVDELFATLAITSELGRNAARLFGRDSSIRRLVDTLAVKLPVSKTSHRGRRTEFHQDGWYNPFDQRSLNFWIALDEVTPEQGPVQFYTGSHKLGPLGYLVSTPNLVTGRPTPAVGLDSWPRLKQCPLSEPNHLRAGDATTHISLVVHGASENATDRPRWAYILVYFPGDALYTNLPSLYTDGLGLEPFQPLDHPNFPLIYTPDA